MNATNIFDTNTTANLNNLKCITSFNPSQNDSIINTMILFSKLTNSEIYVDYSFPCYLFKNNKIRKLKKNTLDLIMNSNPNFDIIVSKLGFEFDLEKIIEIVKINNHNELTILEQIIEIFSYENNLNDPNMLHVKWRSIFLSLSMLIIKILSQYSNQNEIYMSYSKTQTNCLSISSTSAKFEPIIYIDLIVNNQQLFLECLKIAKSIIINNFDEFNEQIISNTHICLTHGQKIKTLNPINQLNISNQSNKLIININKSCAFYSNQFYVNMLENSYIELVLITGGDLAKLKSYKFDNDFTQQNHQDYINQHNESCWNSTIDYFMKLGKLFKKRNCLIITTSHHSVFQDNNLIQNLKQIFDPFNLYENFFSLLRIDDSNIPYEYFSALTILWTLANKKILQNANKKIFIANTIGQTIICDDESAECDYLQNDNVSQTSKNIFSLLFNEAVIFETFIIVPNISKEIKLNKNSVLPIHTQYKLLTNGEEYIEMYDHNIITT